MYQQGNNKNQVIYPDQYGVPINPKPVAPNNPVNQIKYTLPYNPNNPKTEIIKTPHKFNIQNTAYDNKKSGSLSSNVNNKIFTEESVDETYVIDPNTGKKIILQIKNHPKVHTHAYTQQNNVMNLPQNKTYGITQQQGLKKSLNNNIYQPQPKTNDDITASAYHDINASIDPSMASMQRNKQSNEIAYQEQKSPIIENYNINTTILPPYGQGNQIQKDMAALDPKKSASLLTVSSLAKIPYNQYPTAEFSKEPFFNIAGYGFNSYNGKVKKFNEDRIKTIVNYQLKKPCPYKLNISYFSIFDGHSGNKCSDFLKENLDEYLFNSSFFPSDITKSIRESFKKAEDNFKAMAYDEKNNILLDKSGSCALVMLIINNYLYAINLGDSRALYSYDSGKYLFQITRDHKPNDEIEKRRIEKAGGKVFYANTITRNGKEIELKEEQFGKGFSFPYRILPGKIAVSLIYNYLGRKNYWRLLCKSPLTWWIHRRTYF